MPPVPRRSIHLPAPGTKRAVVIGAGSFGTAVAVLLARGGLRTTLQTRTREQAEELAANRENRVYLSGVELPRELRIEHVGAGLARADYVFLGVPSLGLDAVIEMLETNGLSPKAAVVSLAKALVPPNGTPPTVLLTRRFGAERTACIGGPAHAREMVSEGAGLVAASTEESLATALAGVFLRAGVVCEESNDPTGVELAGVAKNAAALASGATEAQGLNAAGAAAGHIFAEVWRWADSHGARPESMIGLAGTGDLVATALAPESRNRRAGELLAQGVPAAEIPSRVGQAVEALQTVPLLARALENANAPAPVTGALARLISGDLPLDDWVEIVRATVPPPARWRPPVRAGFWRRARERISRFFHRRVADGDETFTTDEGPGARLGPGERRDE
ncbi:MAG TPA: NAD(P)H-dependent glycerol-3-phosphate dehydrogenase [Solirubrobacteraceae bacterium]|nr:NAD(P)H-dependent glycerol-3-phosphate dehydrogenase [Solirubrobacteraceae bacterium]